MLENIKKIDAKTCIKSIILAIFSVFCFTIKNGTYHLSKETVTELGGWWPAQLYRLSQAFSDSSSVFFVLFVLFVCAYIVIIQRLKFSHCGISIILSACYALLILFGESYYNLNNWDMVFGSSFALFTSLLRGAGIGIIFFFVLQLIIKIRIPTDEKLVSFRKTFLIISGILLLCWLPYMIIMYPGTMNADTRDQVAQITNNSAYCFTARMIQQDTPDFLWNNCHPVFFTLILKFFVKLGGSIGSYAWGFEIYSILQSIVFILTISFMLTKLRSYGFSSRIIKGCSIFFALNPLFPLWGMTVMKDVPFTICLVIVSIYLYEILSSKIKTSTKEYIILAVALLLMMLFRNNGFYMAIFALPFFVLLLWKEKKKMLSCVGIFCVVILVFKIGITGILFSTLGIGAGSTGEMLSVPFQQTARYIKEHREDVTEEEEKAILAVLNTGGTLDEIAELYVPYRADNVKAKYNPLSTNEDMKKYVKVWLKQLVRHPKSYVQAYLNLIHCWFGMEDLSDNIYYSGVDTCIQDMLPDVKQPESLESARQSISNYVRVLNRCPITSWLLEFSVYSWVYIVLFAIMIIRRNRNAFLTAVMILGNYCICLLGPVGYMRYAIPMIVCLPIIMMLTFATKKQPAASPDPSC